MEPYLLQDGELKELAVKIPGWEIKSEKIQREFKSFDNYIWSFTENKTIKLKLENTLDTSCKLLLSNDISKDLKNRNFKFVGPKICYAFLQAIGIINDHSEDCFRYNEIKKLYNI